MAIVAVTGCGPCWDAVGLTRGPACHEWEPGKFVSAIHDCRVHELEVAGWRLVASLYDDGTDDLLCEHLAAEAA
jgi:hypothetical protein